MVTVVKCTHLDGVTPKDGDIGRTLEMSRINKRVGYVMVTPQEIDDLLDGRFIMMLLAHPTGDGAFTTSCIQDVDFTEDGFYKVTTSNTIYFLQ